MNELAARLRAAREHTRRLTDDLGGERELGLSFRSSIRHAGKSGTSAGSRSFGACEAQLSARRFCRTPISSTTPRRCRMRRAGGCAPRPLPTRLRTATRSWPLERALGKVDAYFVELALRHELMHAEAFHYTRQTLGYPGPDAPPRALVGEGDMALRGGLFRGATRDARFAFDNEKSSHPIVLEPFGISRRPVTYGEYRRFREPLYCKDGRVRRFDRWIPIRDDEPVRHVSWHERLLPVHWPTVADRGRMGVRGPRRPCKRRPRLGMDR